MKKPNELTIEDYKMICKYYHDRNNIIGREKELFRKYKHLEIGKVPSEPMNAKRFPYIPNGEKLFANPDAIFLNMFNRLDYTNELIIEVDLLWEIIKDEPDTNRYDKLDKRSTAISRHMILIEQIIHELRLFIDRAIALTWCISQTQEFDSIKVSDISNCLKDDTFNYYDNNTEYLKRINDIENACKHSFVCHETSFMGRDEPGIWVIYDKYNKLNPRIVGDSLNSIIDGFNEFYKSFFNVLNDLR